MNKIISTPCGEIRGTTCQWPGVTAYKGIRYATAGRWEYPQTVKKWDGVYDATEYGICSWQPRSFFDEALMPEKAFYYNEFRKGETYKYGEDCQYLNIWVPENATADSRLPVIFYIHGGGFTGGCGHEKHFDGPVWPTKGVIAVTINYRMGPLGFACFEELAEKDGHTGNYGLYDQLAALQWVNDNIAAFGGDADNITIMGQSAGAMSVQTLCLSPLAKGLFSKAVMSSAGGVNEAFAVKDSAENRYGFWNEVIKQAGCENLDQLKAVSAKDLFDAWTAARKATNLTDNNMRPCIDGHMLPKPMLEIVAEGDFADVPYMLGSTSHDIVPPILFSMAKDWVTLQTKQGKQDSYCWFFDRMLPGDNEGAWHSSDLWYWFGTLDNCWRPFEEKDWHLSDALTTYLCSFAKTGVPSGENLPEWTPTKANTDDVLCWGEDGIKMGQVDMERLVEIMRTTSPVGE